MKIYFKEKALEELYEYGTTKESKYKKLCRDNKLVLGYKRAVQAMYDVNSTKELSQYSYLHYERLRYQQDRSSVRLVNGYIHRLIFVEVNDGIEVELIEIDDTHYGNKK